MNKGALKSAIEIHAKKKGVSLAWLARQTDQTPQNLNGKFSRGDMPYSELRIIAITLDTDPHKLVQTIEKENDRITIDNLAELPEII